VSQLSRHSAQHRTIDTYGAPIAVLDRSPAGDRRATALLVPGYTGSKEDFAPLLEPLAAAGVRVVAMDQPGQYQSPGPDQPGDYAVPWLGSVVCAVAKALDDGPVHLLGHSFGGLVARDAVLSEPASFCSLTLLCSGPAALGGVRQHRMAALEPLLPLGMGAVYQAVEQLAAADPRWIGAPAELKAFLKERFLASSADGLKGMGEALLSEQDRVAELASAGLPVLVCYGETDDAWQPSTQAAMAARLGARDVVIGGAGHSPAIENTPATVEALLSFWFAEETR
jgi:pimeloyl-ACP methyl ester carboxylesterase